MIDVILGIIQNVIILSDIRNFKIETKEGFVMIIDVKKRKTTCHWKVRSYKINPNKIKA